MFNLIAAFLIALVTYVLYITIYNLYFHPLAKYPGPTSWVFSDLADTLAFASGNLPRSLERLHTKYGDVVRFGPRNVAFFTPDAWQDIYSQGKHKVFIKDPGSYREPVVGVRDLLTASDADHRRYRALVSHAFSDRALKEQQPIIDSHVDLLMQRLREVSKNHGPVDIHEWFNYTTFDIIGDLAFGEPFGCLESSANHPWVGELFSYLKTVAIISVLDSWVPMKYILPWIPKFLVRTMSQHMDMTREKVERRLATETSRKDFMHFILRHNDENGMNAEELMANMALIIIAGSETTTTALAATTYLLLKNPTVLKRLEDEVRTKFSGLEGMTMEKLDGFEYLNAVVQESMRLHPPAPGGLPRFVTTDNAVVAGHPVPKGTTVSLQAYGAYRSPRNFTNPTSFDPLRWMDEGRHEKDRLDTVEPFSIGHRNCIGKNLAWFEMRLILTRLLFEFDLELVDDGFNLDEQKTFVLWNSPPLNVKLRVHSELRARAK